MENDLYEILGVAKDASQQDIKRAYRRLAKENHPDLHPGDAEKEEQFKRISAAYEVLSDEEKRATYDRFGSTKGNPFGGGMGGMGGAGGMGDLFDVLNSVFGGGFGGGGFGGRGGRSRARRGQDFRMELEVTFTEAAFGAEREIEIPHYDDCETCDGTGAKPGTSPQTCTMCAGAGVITQQQGFFAMQRTCPRCQGEGTIIADKCTTCKGERYIRSEETLEIDIPAGIDTGQQLRWSGKGAPGEHGGPRGDLYVVIRLEDHPLFDREGRDVICVVPIGFTQAALGAKVEVPTLDGKVNMTIPEGTQTGKVFRLRGKGFPGLDGGGRGDQLVEVVVETPVRLSERQRELLVEFAEISGDDVHPEKQSFFDRLKHLFD
jgi:molecular chaperone DnaJ